MKYQCGIFDLDGVLVDTAKYHYLGWKKLADRLGFHLQSSRRRPSRASRMAALDLLWEREE